MADYLQADETIASSELSDISRDEPRIKNYDFRHPKLVSKEIMRALYKIHNLFARSIKRIFANVLSVNVEVTLSEIEQVIFSEFLNTLEPPTALFLFNIEELGDWALLQMDPAFCIFFVEHQSGGRAVELGEDRRLTRIEERVMGRTIDKIFKELTHVWSSYVNMTISHHVYESKPANIRTISSHIPGITVIFMLQVEKLKVPFRVCYPYALLKEQMMSSFGNLSDNSKKQRLSTHQHLQFKNKMKQVNVVAQATLGSTEMPIQQLLNLDSGDLIKLDQPVNEPLKITINNKLKMYGYPGVKRGKKAIKVFEVLKNDKLNIDL